MSTGIGDHRDLDSLEAVCTPYPPDLGPHGAVDGSLGDVADGQVRDRDWARRREARDTLNGIWERLSEAIELTGALRCKAIAKILV
jgi:hypothetical protein